LLARLLPCGRPQELDRRFARHPLKGTAVRSPPSTGEQRDRRFR
jgi:hypothetical protein